MIKDIVDEAVATAESQARLMAESNARLAVTIRETPARVEHMLGFAEQLQARARVSPSVGIMIDAMSDLRQALDETILDLERMIGAVTS